MNDPFEDASHLEEYFQRCLFYAVFPSMFHAHTGTSAAYFWEPRYPNRDRALFLKYVPLVRMLDEAGWEPIPYAKTEPEDVRVERYGDFARGTLVLTVHNPAPEERPVVLRLQRAALRLPEGVSCIERISGSTVSMETTSDEVLVHVPMRPGGYAMVSVNAKTAPQP